jgi:hypothetical protein
LNAHWHPSTSIKNQPGAQSSEAQIVHDEQMLLIGDQRDKHLFVIARCLLGPIDASALARMVFYPFTFGQVLH